MWVLPCFGVSGPQAGPFSHTLARFLPPNGQWEDFPRTRIHSLHGPAREPHRTLNRINNNNQGAITLIKNPYITKQLKYINICYYFIRDLAKRERLEITYIPTNRIVANGITKPLARVAFERFKDQIGIVDEGRIYK